MTRLYLADKSAYGQRQHNADARAIFDAFTDNGTLATCEMIALEILYSARNLADYERTREGLESLPWLETSNKAMRRAIDIQHALARRGQHRTSLPDVIIAATAEEHGAVVLHFDSDFDRIAAITGQEMLWIVPRPSRPIAPS